MVRTAHTAQLTHDQRADIRALLDEAFEGQFSDDDWDHALGGMHAWVLDGERVVAHGSVIQRRVLHHDRSLRVGYVEAVAVRASHRGQGNGGRVMDVLEEFVERAYDVGALSASDGGAAFYAARGWRRWPGRVSTLTPSGVVPLADGDTTHLWPVLPEPADELIFDWRSGDVL